MDQHTQPIDIDDLVSCEHCGIVFDTAVVDGCPRCREAKEIGRTRLR